MEEQEFVSVLPTVKQRHTLTGPSKSRVKLESKEQAKAHADQKAQAKAQAKARAQATKKAAIQPEPISEAPASSVEAAQPTEQALDAPRLDRDGNWVVDMTLPQSQLDVLNMIASYLDMTKRSNGSYELIPAPVTFTGKDVQAAQKLVKAGHIEQVTTGWLFTDSGLALFGITLVDIIVNYESRLADWEANHE